MNDEIKLKRAQACLHCDPKLEQLEKILRDFENGHLPKDMKLTLELNMDWLGRRCWHLDSVKLEKRKP